MDFPCGSKLLSIYLGSSYTLTNCLQCMFTVLSSSGNLLSVLGRGETEFVWNEEYNVCTVLVDLCEKCCPSVIDDNRTVYCLQRC